MWHTFDKQAKYQVAAFLTNELQAQYQITNKKQIKFNLITKYKNEKLQVQSVSQI